MVIWAVVSYEINRLIEWFPSRRGGPDDARHRRCGRPDWRWIMNVEPIVP
jgi:hypothetical protein